MYVQNEIIASLDNGRSIAQLLYQSVAFYTTGHKILAHRLQHWFGISSRSSTTDIRNLQRNFQATQMEQSNGNSNSKLAASMNELNAKVDKISEHMLLMRSTMDFFLGADPNLPSAATNLHTTELAGSMEATNQRNNKRIADAPHVSYAQALSKDISNVVKTTVVDSLKIQRQFDRVALSIVIFGLPEKKDDLNKVKYILNILECCSTVVNFVRLESPPESSASSLKKSTPKGRPLYVELSSSAD